MYYDLFFRPKAAYNAYLDRELPNVRADVRGPSSVLLAPFLQSLFSQQPGLRLQQYKVLRIILRSLRFPELISVCQ